MTVPRNVNLQMLEHLKVLVTERHVTRAAAAANIGQPAMSASLARLRAMLKDPLLVKTARGMEPTPYAIELAKAIQIAFEALDSPQRLRSDIDIASTERTIRIMSSQGPAPLFLPTLMARVRREAPMLTIHWTSGDLRRAAELLREGEVDLVISSLRNIPSDYYSSPLFAQRACCIAARGHPAIQGELTTTQFLAFPHVVFGSFGAAPAAYSFVDSLVETSLDRLGLKRTIAVTVPSFLVSPAIVAASDLLAVIPDRVASESPDRHRLQILELPFDIGPLDLTMYWHTRCQADPAHRWIRAALRESTTSAATHREAAQS